MRVLIVKTSSMGDVIHALPVVADLRRARPDGVIDWAVEEGFASIVRMNADVHRVIPVGLRRWRNAPGRRATWREVANLRRALREAPYDRVIDCQGLLKSAFVARLARGPVTGFDARSAREPLAAFAYHQAVAVPRDRHAIERNRRVSAAALGYVPQGMPAFGLSRLPEPDIVTLAALGGQPYVALLTNASRPTKLWPDDRWTALAAALATQGLRALLFAGSTSERLATERRAETMVGSVVAPPLPLDGVAALLAGASLVVGLDTGLSHLAAALGRPSVGLFCDYDPALVGLIGSGPCVSIGGIQQQPAVTAVLDGIDLVLERHPRDPSLDNVVSGSGSMPELPGSAPRILRAPSGS